MKIALLNLTVDNNFGGNLQRYALMKVLSDLGHNVTFLNIRTKYKLKWYKYPYSYMKRVLKKMFNHYVHIRLEKYKTLEMERLCGKQKEFFDKYVNHTNPLFTEKDLISESQKAYDAFIVGSDQVWRKRMTRQIGLKNYFFYFLKDIPVIKIAYSASFGVDYNQYTRNEIKQLGNLYRQFNAISVREISALKLLHFYGWQTPNAMVTLDPTLLLDRNDYICLIKDNPVHDKAKDKIFCYVLDSTREIDNLIKSKSQELGVGVVMCNLSEDTEISIVQWVANIHNAQLIITDSYHGTIFSLIFNKPFLLLKNEDRGGCRFDSLAALLNISFNDSLSLDYDKLNQRIEVLRNQSIAFFNNVLQ